MSRDVEIAVVGSGIAGLATAHSLAREGREIAVFEQFRLGHERGSSHGATRIFRLAYPDPDWIRLAQEALIGWGRLEVESGTQLLALVGLVELVRDLSESSQRALDACGVECRVLDASDAAREFGLRVPMGFSALLQPDAGFVYAEHAHAAFASDLTVGEGIRVTGLADLGETVRLDTSIGSLEASAVVVTAGPWARVLLKTAGIPLFVQETRETVAYFELATPQLPPAVAEFQTDARRHAFYAVHDPVYGLKAGLNGSGGATDPDQEEGPDEAVVEQIAAWVADRFPLERHEPVHVETCLYTNTSDERFVLERHGRIVVGSACSGHAFKFMPVVGRRLAELAIEALG